MLVDSVSLLSQKSPLVGLSVIEFSGQNLMKALTCNLILGHCPGPPGHEPLPVGIKFVLHPVVEDNWQAVAW